MDNLLPFDKGTKTFIIVIKDNKASEYYASYVLPSWELEGIYPEVFDAVTPETLNNYSDLKFGVSKALKYVNRKIVKHFTSTEKACFYSHFLLWQKCIDLNVPLLILEHDSFLDNPDALREYKDKWFITYDNSFGCYKIYPDFAKVLVKFCQRYVLNLGPMGTVEMCVRILRDHPQYSNLAKFCLFVSSPEFKKAVVQVKSKELGNTIDHYDDLNLDDILVNVFNNDVTKFEKFKNQYNFRYIP